jgi:hypothetical protein
MNYLTSERAWEALPPITFAQMLEVSKYLKINLRHDFIKGMLQEAMDIGSGGRTRGNERAQATEPAIALADFERVMARTCLY